MLAKELSNIVWIRDGEVNLGNLSIKIFVRVSFPMEMVKIHQKRRRGPNWSNKLESGKWFCIYNNTLVARFLEDLKYTLFLSEGNRKTFTLWWNVFSVGAGQAEHLLEYFYKLMVPSPIPQLKIRNILYNLSVPTSTPS